MTREEIMKEGSVYYCLHCHSAYKKVPTEWYEDGHGGRHITMCNCGCDLIALLSNDELVNWDGKTK